jgi:flagellar basal-body rod protein FlgG
MVTAITREFAPGNIITTGESLDLTIEGEGFFEVEAPQGDAVYTRAGNFYLSDGGDGTYLVNGNGYFVHDANGERIRAPGDTAAVSVSGEGVITFSTAAGIATRAQLGVYAFGNDTGLTLAGNGTYAQSATSGPQSTNGVGTVIQGALEGSNVSLSTEMTRLIRAQRAFSLAARALTTADDMEGIANNLRK